MWRENGAIPGADEGRGVAWYEEAYGLVVGFVVGICWLLPSGLFHHDPCGVAKG